MMARSHGELELFEGVDVVPPGEPRGEQPEHQERLRAARRPGPLTHGWYCL